MHTLSVHNDHWGSTDAVASTSIALGPDVEDAEYLRTLREALPPVFESVRPGLVFYVAGIDPAFDDPIGNWRVSPAALLGARPHRHSARPRRRAARGRSS